MGIIQGNIRIYRDDRKENGNHYLGFRGITLAFVAAGLHSKKAEVALAQATSATQGALTLDFVTPLAIMRSRPSPLINYSQIGNVDSGERDANISPKP